MGVKSVTCTATDSLGHTNSKSVSYTVKYRFLGFQSPIPQSSYKAGSTIPVKFVLTTSSASATPISASLAAALAAAGKVKATLTGPGISAQTVACTWSTPGLFFQCNINTPKKGLLTDTAYTITVSEAVGTGFVTAPAVGSAVNPETVFFK